jgi:tetratricopeptide (TPR) repeat protein
MQTDLTTQPIEDLVDLALASHNRGQLSEAEDLYQQVLDRDPENSKVLNLLGYLYHQIRDYELAIKLIGQAIFVDPEQPYFYHTAGKVYFANRNFEDAIDAFRQAINLGDATAENYDCLINSLEADNRYEEATQAILSKEQIHKSSLPYIAVPSLVRYNSSNE